MAQTREVVIVGAARTAIGSFGGKFKGVEPSTLGIVATEAALKRAGVEADEVGHAVIGNVIPNDPKDCYIARRIAVGAGIPVERPAMTVNRLCGSGAQAVVSAAQMIMLGDVDVALAGGAESMSGAPYAIEAARFGQKMGDIKTTDWLTGALSDPFGHGHMGVTAENVAERYQIARERQDAFACESHARASSARSEGRFVEQIAPVELQTRKGPVVIDQDEHIREGATLADFEKLRPVFKKDGRVTAGNASGINDGAGAIVLMEAGRAVATDRKPLARIVAYGHAGVEPEVMGIGPIKAVPNALAKAGLTMADIDVIESNEAFASQAIAVLDELGLDPAKTNPNGGAIALGHPIGATGAILHVKVLHELIRTGGRYGLVTMCIGGGQGIAVILERLSDTWH